jgi:hypothetical protein
VSTGLRSISSCLHVFGSSAAATVSLATGGTGVSTGATCSPINAVANQRVSIYRLILTIGTPAVTVTLQDTAGTALSQPFQLAANGAVTLDIPINGDPWWTNTATAAGLGIQLSQSGTTTIGYDIYYMQGP